MCLLSNLMFGSDENKLEIGRTCGDEIVHVVRVHFADANLYKVGGGVVGLVEPGGWDGPGDSGCPRVNQVHLETFVRVLCAGRRGGGLRQAR